MEEEPIEKFTEYRSRYCKVLPGDVEPTPDVKPISKGLYKYYRNADNFTYNQQHSNKAY